MPLLTAGSLRPTFVPARLVSLAGKLPYACALYARLATLLSPPLLASITCSDATAPIKLRTSRCSRPGSRHRARSPESEGWYPKVASTETGVPASKAPTYPGQRTPDFNVKLQ